ncbi:hypothetical protein [Clostridium butyricum]|nr:hypothetical protein [Clostridium butyricum]
MKLFKEQFVDFKSFNNDKYLMNSVSVDLLRELSYVIINELRNTVKNYKGKGRIDFDASLKRLCDIISEYTNTEKTTNWGMPYLQNDFEDSIYYFNSKPFNKFMDSMSKIAIEYFNGTSINAMNEAFEENNFGYRLQMNIDAPWICINTEIEMVNNIEEIIITTEELSRQTAEHIRQAREQLKRVNDERARKDAIRDSLSAMETLMKKFTNTSGVVEADRAMRADQNKWGPKVIIGEGIKLWKLFHEEYHDIRHGDDEISNITTDQAIYFIDRILAYVNYICKVEQMN